MVKLKFTSIALILLAVQLADVSNAASNQAKQILQMAAAMLYKAPAGNGFIRIYEQNPFNLAYKMITDRVALMAKRKCGNKKRDLPDKQKYDKELNYEEDLDIDQSAQQNVLNLLDTMEGLMILFEQLPIRERLANVKEMKSKRAAKIMTWMYYIPSGKLNGKTKAAVLLTRVRNAMANKYTFRLLAQALKDGTTRTALQNLSACPDLASYNSYIRL